MRIRSSLVSLLVLVILFFLILLPDLIEWPVIIGLVILAFFWNGSSKWSDRYLGAIAGVMAMTGLLAGIIPLPYIWLKGLGVPFGISVTLSVLAAFVFTSLTIVAVLRVVKVLYRSFPLSSSDR